MAKAKNTNKGEFGAVLESVVGNVLDTTQDLSEQKTEYISTGILLLDMLLGGGIIKNRIMVLGAGTSVGKTTLCIQIAKNFIEQNIAQGKGDVTQVIYIDAENALTYNRFLQLGIKPEWLGLKTVESETGKRYVKDNSIVPKLIARSGKISWIQIEKMFNELAVVASRYEGQNKPELLIIIDSIPAIDTPDSEEKSLSESEQPGQMAKMIGRLTNKLIKILPYMNATVIFVNHVRPVIQAMPMQPVSVGGLVKSGMRLPGGTILQYLASQILIMKQKGQKELGGLTLKFIEATTWKNRAFASDKSVTLVYEDTYGFSEALTNFIYLRDIKVLTPSGGRWTVADKEFVRKYPVLEKKRTVKEIISDFIKDPEFRKAFVELTRHHAYERLVKPYILTEQLPDLAQVIATGEMVDEQLETLAETEETIKKDQHANTNNSGDLDFTL